MTYELRYNDLIRVTSEDLPRGSIYWLRLLCDDKRIVAIVTEVPLNPGLPMFINTSDIRRHIKRLLSVDLHGLKLYRVLPRGHPEPQSPIVFTKGKGSISLVALEASLGLQLPELPENLELRRKVMGLGGAETEYDLREVFEAVPVTDLPPPHYLSRCAHKSRFDAMKDEVRWMSLDEVGRRFIDSLTADEIGACWWHQAADWAAIANESVRVVETVGELKRKGDYSREAERSGLPDEDRRWLKSLFDTPIIITGGGYTNGQHRACSLRFSGASRAAVVTGYESVPIRRNDWQYKGDG